MVRLGIVGTGMMAGIIAECCCDAGINLHSVLSRTEESSEHFGLKHGIPSGRRFSRCEDFFSDNELDVVYIATPTSEKEYLFRLCLEFEKHVLIEKPIPTTSSMYNLLINAVSKHLIWIDATHYIYAQWYQQFDELLDKHVGTVNRIQVSFFWPDRNIKQIKFNPALEPYGVVGDLGWYPLRLISKFVSSGSIRQIRSILLHGDNDAIVDMNVIGHTCTETLFMASASYNDSAVQQRLEISGSKGRLSIDDFVMPYSGSFVYGTLKQDMRIHIEWGMKPLIDKKEIIINIREKQHISMLKSLAGFIDNSDGPRIEELQTECLNTVELIRLIQDLPA